MPLYQSATRPTTFLQRKGDWLRCLGHTAGAYTSFIGGLHQPAHRSFGVGYDHVPAPVSVSVSVRPVTNHRVASAGFGVASLLQFVPKVSRE